MNPPNAPATRPTASTIGLAVLLAAIMVGAAAITWFISPASANATSDDCGELVETREESLRQVLTTTGQEQTEAVHRAWAATELMEEC